MEFCVIFISLSSVFSLSSSPVILAPVPSRSDSLTYNKMLGLTTINLSHNALEDKGMTAFANYISSMNRGLVKLNLSQCSVGKVVRVSLPRSSRLSSSSHSHSHSFSFTGYGCSLQRPQKERAHEFHFGAL